MSLKNIPEKILRSFLLLNLAVGIFIVIMPFIPELQYRLSANTSIEPLSYEPTSEEIKDNSIAQTTQRKIYRTDGNRIVISKINVDTKILEGENEDVMLREEGAWRDPHTSIPGKNGNIVVGGHRFQYLPPNTTTFYNLDKLKNGDEVKIYWDGYEYIYKIYEIFEVNPDAVWIKSQDTEREELTIYTCTPVFSSARRLVVKAYLLN